MPKGDVCVLFPSALLLTAVNAAAAVPVRPVLITPDDFFKVKESFQPFLIATVSQTALICHHVKVYQGKRVALWKKNEAAAIRTGS